MTIAAKNDYCYSIDIAGSTIAILLLLWTTIAILLWCYCLKHYDKRNISEYCQSPLILLKCMGGNSIYILLPFNLLFDSNQTILKWKSLCLKTIETIAKLKRLWGYYWHRHFPIDVVTLPRLLLRYINSLMYCYIPSILRPSFYGKSPSKFWIQEYSWNLSPLWCDIYSWHYGTNKEKTKFCKHKCGRWIFLQRAE